jgi:aryl-phospho-beta-D-glucosidase BglC (GH1 family)
MNIKHPVITNVKSILCICGAITALVLGQQSTLAAPPALHTVGNKLADTKGSTVRLQGVNVPSLDWDPAGERVLESIDVALTNWNANIIRIPLTQDFWFGYHKGQKSTLTESSYQKLVDAVVSRISAANKYVLLDLHWSDGGVWGSHVGQHAMPDDNSVLFWKSVAKRFANNPAVLFDLYNEPHDVSWDVWKNGGAVEERNDDPARGKHLMYHTPGMQALVDTVRATGAKNIVVAGGLDWAYDLRGIVAGSALTERGGNGIMYATHIYPWKKDWDVNVTPAAVKYPVFVGEVGTKPWHEGEPAHENVYTEAWAPDVIKYIQKHNLSWTAWSFHPSANPCLITGWDYTPTEYWGRYVKAALATKKK